MIHSITPRPTTPDDGAIFNERESILQYNIDIDYSVKDTLKTFKEEVLDELYAQYSLHGNMPVMFSGGMDSTFIVRSLIELGIKPKTSSFSFSTDNSDYESQLVKRRCAEHGLDDPEFIYIDCDGFTNHCRYLNEERNIKYSSLHGYLVDYFLSKTGDIKFMSGMSCEYKIRDNNIIMLSLPYTVKRNNPDRVFGFSTDRTFLSYFKHKQFIDNYKKKIPKILNRNTDMWFVRDLIYMDCYPDITKEVKDVEESQRDYLIPTFKSLPRPEPVAYCKFDPDYLVNL